MNSETEKSPREIAESIAVRGLPFSAFINSVEYRNARVWIANAIDEALLDERERAARIADKFAAQNHEGAVKAARRKDMGTHDVLDS